MFTVWDVEFLLSYVSASALGHPAVNITSTEQLAAMDVNNDGVISISDVSFLLSLKFGLSRVLTSVSHVYGSDSGNPCALTINATFATGNKYISLDWTTTKVYVDIESQSSLLTYGIDSGFFVIQGTTVIGTKESPFNGAVLQAASLGNGVFISEFFIPNSILYTFGVSLFDVSLDGTGSAIPGSLQYRIAPFNSTWEAYPYPLSLNVSGLEIV